MAAAVVAAVLTIGLPGCGGGGGGTTPTTVPPAPVRRQVFAVNFTNVLGIPDALDEGFLFDFARADFSTSATGTLEAQCDWTFATNDIDIAISRGSCSAAQLLADQCTLLVESTSTVAKPERVSASNVAAGAFTLFIINFGLTSESGNCQVFLTS